MPDARFRLLQAASCLLLTAGALFAQAPAGSHPTRTIAAVEAETAPIIDGLLDDAVWLAADWQEAFSQQKPDLGTAPGAATRVAIAYDGEHLYAAFRCFNPDGASANSSTATRDGDMDTDNAVTLYLDTFHTRRDCYYFSTNSLGTQIDGRIGEDGATNDKKWDCVWWVVSHEDSLGWSCEMKIPVSEIRIPRGGDRVWGINFRRNYPALFETSFWQHRDVAWRISQSGELVGLPAFDKLFSATLYPYLVGFDTNQPSSGRRTIVSSDGRELIGGADLRLKLGNAMDGNITYNPDFATVEGDLTQINLTRYETSFPEKRLYFLEGAELFNNELNVFYSRRIGDIDWGVKTNGRVGKLNYAALAVDERAENGDPSSHTEVVRMQRDFLGTSNVGLTAVSRTYDGGYNRVLSGDAFLKLNPNTHLRAQYVGSFPSLDSQDYAGALAMRFSYNKGVYTVNWGIYDYDRGYRDNVNPVGFVNDDNFTRPFTWFSGEYWIRRWGIDKIGYNQGNDIAWWHNGNLKEVQIRGWTGVTFKQNWLVGWGFNQQIEHWEKRFDNSTWTLEAAWDDRVSRQANILYVFGKNYDRDVSRTRYRTTIQSLYNLSFTLAYTRLRFDPDPSGQGTDLYDVSADYNITPDIWFRLTNQYTSRNDRLYLYGLFGWRFSPPFGALYVAYTGDRFEMLSDELGRVIDRRDRAFFIKLTVPLSIY